MGCGQDILLLSRVRTAVFMRSCNMCMVVLRESVAQGSFVKSMAGSSCSQHALGPGLDQSASNAQRLHCLRALSTCSLKCPKIHLVRLQAAVRSRTFRSCTGGKSLKLEVP